MQHGGRRQFVDSSFGFDDLLELRSFLLGDRTRDNLQLSEPDSLESDLDRFSLVNFGDLSLVDVSEGGAGALQLRRDVGSAPLSVMVASRRDVTYSSSRCAYLRFRLWYFCSSCSRSSLMPMICSRATFATP